MASKRKLKKDVNYFIYELLTQCFTLKHFNPDMSEEKFTEVVHEIVNKRNELISMINNPIIKEEEKLNKYYNKIRQELVELVTIAEKI